MPRIREEWYIIVNPHAGSGKTMQKWIPAEKKLKKLGVPFYTVFTTHKHHAIELAATAARTGYRKIMAVGGDGSLHEVFNGVLSWCEVAGVSPSEFYLAVAPIGSGNDWIKAFNVPDDTEDVVKLVAEKSFCKEDVVKVTCAGDNVRYMANIGGIGFDSHVCVRVNAQKERGLRSKRIYINSLIYNILHTKPINVSVSCDDDEIFCGEVLSIALGNGKYSGGGMRQCCKADPSDGILDVLVVPKMPLGKILKALPTIFNGTTSECSLMTYARGKKITIVPLDKESADLLELDGEIDGNIPMVAEVEDKYVNVLSGRKE